MKVLTGGIVRERENIGSQLGLRTGFERGIGVIPIPTVIVWMGEDELLFYAFCVGLLAQPYKTPERRAFQVYIF